MLQPKKSLKKPSGETPKYTSKSMPGKNALQAAAEKGLNIKANLKQGSSSSVSMPSGKKESKPSVSNNGPKEPKEMTARQKARAVAKKLKGERKTARQKFKTQKQQAKRNIQMAKLEGKEKQFKEGTAATASQKATRAAEAGGAILGTIATASELVKKLRGGNTND